MARRRLREDVGYGGESPEDFWGALRGVWFAPVRFFRGLDPRGGVLRPAIFASVVLYLDLLLEAVLQMLWLREFNYALIYVPFFGLVVAIVLAPLLVAGLAILVLVILGRGTLSRGGFVPLFRSLGYASGIAFALWIPFATLLAIPYGAFVATLAVKEMLNVTWARAAAATLIPLGAVILTVLALLGPGDAAGFLVNPPGS
ncbi:MAG: YIP1 family protein [Actinomycetota bacterium]|nr:YIP1 family protein [Actinomycetota bacterium]